MGKMKWESKEWREIGDYLKKYPEYYAEGLAFKITLAINRAMKKQGLKCIDLAKRMKVSKSYISQLLDGDANMTLLTIGKIVLALGLENVDIILEEKREPEIEEIKVEEIKIEDNFRTAINVSFLNSEGSYIQELQYLQNWDNNIRDKESMLIGV